jgi:hypothetical protein
MSFGSVCRFVTRFLLMTPDLVIQMTGFIVKNSIRQTLRRWRYDTRHHGPIGYGYPDGANRWI